MLTSCQTHLVWTDINFHLTAPGKKKQNRTLSNMHCSLLLFLCVFNFAVISVTILEMSTKRLVFSWSDLLRAQVQRMEKVSLSLSAYYLSWQFIYSDESSTNISSSLSDSDKDEGSYCPPVKRERTSSFPPPHSGKGMWWLNLITCGVPIDLYADCNACLLLCSSQEQCIHALKFLPVSDWELWLWARWDIETTITFS